MKLKNKFKKSSKVKKPSSPRQHAKKTKKKLSLPAWVKDLVKKLTDNIDKLKPNRQVLYRSASKSNYNSELLSRVNILKYPLGIFLALFAAGIFIMKIDLLSSLNIVEAARYDQVRYLSGIEKLAIEPIHGILQWLTVLALPDNQIAAMRIPGALMILATLAISTFILYIKSDNRYAPYAFFTLGAGSPALAWLAHSGYVAHIDSVFLLSVMYLSYLVLNKYNLSYRRRMYLYASFFATAPLLLIQPFGIFMLGLSAGYLMAKNKTFLGEAWAMGKKAKLLIYGSILPSVGLVLWLGVNGLTNIKIFSGFKIAESLVEGAGNLMGETLMNMAGIFGISIRNNADLSGAKANYLFIICVLFTIYVLLQYVYKRLRDRKNDLRPILTNPGLRLVLLIILIDGLFLSAASLTSLGILPATLSLIAIVSLTIAQMVRSIDLRFPVNPYPKIIAKTAILTLVLVVVVAGVMDIGNQLPRQLSAPEINEKIQNDSIYYERDLVL